MIIIRVMYICICNAVTEKAVRECADDGARSVEDLAITLGVGVGCGRCRECASELLRNACHGDDGEAILSTAA
jgi:bacterioferritin-associated ferredoxin